MVAAPKTEAGGAGGGRKVQEKKHSWEGRKEEGNDSPRNALGTRKDWETPGCTLSYVLRPRDSRDGPLWGSGGCHPPTPPASSVPRRAGGATCIPPRPAPLRCALPPSPPQPPPSPRLRLRQRYRPLPFQTSLTPPKVTRSLLQQGRKPSHPGTLRGDRGTLHAHGAPRAHGWAHGSPARREGRDRRVREEPPEPSRDTPASPRPPSPVPRSPGPRSAPARRPGWRSAFAHSPCAPALLSALRKPFPC